LEELAMAGVGELKKIRRERERERELARGRWLRR
jgi:hypothetical protein